MRARFAAALATAVLVLAGCDQPGVGGSAQGPGTAGPTAGVGMAGDQSGGDAVPATEPAAGGVEYRVTSDWSVPAPAVSVRHSFKVPIAGPSLPPLPYLVAVYVGDHPEGTPAFGRISFYFRGTFPSYRVEYVSGVVSDGKGTPIPLQGNAFLQIGFIDAQAHDNSGASTVTTTPRNPIGFATMKSYGFAGDFEGHVTYGLGLQVAPNSDQTPKIRTGELKKPDGSGGFLYVVFVDVQNG